jgi:hypothetical protein
MDFELSFYSMKLFQLLRGKIGYIFDYDFRNKIAYNSITAGINLSGDDEY